MPSPHNAQRFFCRVNEDFWVARENSLGLRMSFGMVDVTHPAPDQALHRIGQLSVSMLGVISFPSLRELLLNFVFWNVVPPNSRSENASPKRGHVVGRATSVANGWILRD